MGMILSLSLSLDFKIILARENERTLCRKVKKDEMSGIKLKFNLWKSDYTNEELREKSEPESATLISTQNIKKNIINLIKIKVVYDSERLGTHPSRGLKAVVNHHVAKAVVQVAKLS